MPIYLPGETAVDAAKVANITVTQAVDLDALEARVNSLDAAVVLRGSWDASAGTFPGVSLAQAGDSYIVSVAGTVDSVAFSVGDRIVALTDNASTTVYITNWLKLDYSDLVTSVVGLGGAVTVAQVLSALLAVDGAGSGLDADLLDGVSSSGYYSVGGTDVAVADGGTGASSVASARDNLGVFRGGGVPPAGFLAETVSRDLIVSGSSGLNSGTLRLVAVWLPIGLTVTSITFVSAAQAAVAPTNWWFGLFDSARAALRLTADQTNTAWAANTPKPVNLTSSFVTTYSGVHYLGIMMAAGTAISVQVYTANATLNALPPIRIGNTTDTGLTTPPSLPFTAGVITSSVNIVYAGVS